MADYIVKKGDNLSRIAKKNGLTVTQILKENPGIKDPNKIFPGQKIKLPAIGSAVKKAIDKIIKPSTGIATPPFTPSATVPDVDDSSLPLPRKSALPWPLFIGAAALFIFLRKK